MPSFLLCGHSALTTLAFLPLHKHMNLCSCLRAFALAVPATLSWTVLSLPLPMAASFPSFRFQLKYPLHEFFTTPSKVVTPISSQSLCLQLNEPNPQLSYLSVLLLIAPVPDLILNSLRADILAVLPLYIQNAWTILWPYPING